MWAPGEGSAFWGVRGISTTGRTQHLAGWEVLAPERAQLLGGRGQRGEAFSSKMERQRAEFMQNEKKTQEFQRLASDFVSNLAVPSSKFS